MARRNQMGGAVAPREVGKPVAGKSYRQLGPNRYRNTKQGSPRRGKTFRINPRGAHVYGSGAVIGGKQRATVRPRQKARLRPQFDPTAPLTRGAFNRELNAATRVQYRPQINAARQELAISQEKQRGTDDWYTNIYLPELRRAGEQSKQAYTAAAQSTRTTAGQAYTGDMARLDAQQAQAQQSAAQRGATVDPSVDAQARQAAAHRQSQAQSQAGLIDTLGAGQATYHAQQPVVARTQQAQYRREEHNVRAQLRKELLSLLKDRGAFRNEYRGKLIDRERTYGLERAAFGLDQAKAAADAADAAAKRRAARREARRAQGNKDREFEAGRDDEDFDRLNTTADNERADREAARRAAGGGSSLTPTQRRGYQQDFGQAVALVRGKIKKTRKNPSAAVEALVAEKGYPRIIARAAVQRALNGSVKPDVARKMRRRFGVRAKTGGGSVQLIGGVPVSEIDRVNRGR